MLRKMELQWETPYNIIFGGIGLVTNTREKLSQVITVGAIGGSPLIPPSEITYFKVNGEDVYANVGVGRGIRAGAFNNRNDLKFVKDLGAIGYIGANSFRIAREVERLELDSVTHIDTTAITGVNKLNYVSMRGCKVITQQNFYEIQAFGEIHINEALNTTPIGAGLSYAVDSKLCKVYFYNDAGILTGTINT